MNDNSASGKLKAWPNCSQYNQNHILAIDVLTYSLVKFVQRENKRIKRLILKRFNCYTVFHSKHLTSRTVNIKAKITTQ